MITLKKAEEEDANFRATVDGHVKSIADGRAYIILNDGAPVGVIAYTMFWEELPFLTLIKLLPEYRRRGFGRVAIALFEEELKSLAFAHCSFPRRPTRRRSIFTARRVTESAAV